MGRSASKREKLDLLTTNFNYRTLVGENILRFFIVKDLLMEEEPAREKGQPFPLGDLSAWVSISDVSVDEKDKISLKGKIEGKAVFYGVQGPKEVAFEEEEFIREVEVPGALPGMDVNAHGRISFLGEEEAPIEAEGRFVYQLKIEVEVLVSVADPQQLNVAVGVKDVAPEKVSHAVIAAEELVEEKAVPLTLTKEYQFNENIRFIKAINCYIKDFNWALEKEGVTFSGELGTVFYYLAGEESGFKENRQKFSKQVSFPDLKKKTQVRIFPRVEYAIYDIKEKTANETAYLDVLIRVTRTVQQEIINDIQEVSVKKEYLVLPKSTGVVKEPLELVQKLDFPYPREVAAGPCRLLNLEVDVEEDRVEVTGTLEKVIYYIPADERELDEEDEKELLPVVVKAEEDFQSSLFLPGVGPGVETAVYFNMHAVEFAPTENATLQVSHATLEVRAWEMQDFAVVVPQRVPPGTSMVVYSVKKGDTLLKIARSYGVKPPVIARANGIEEDASLDAGQKLLIPLIFAE